MFEEAARYVGCRCVRGGRLCPGAEDAVKPATQVEKKADSKTAKEGQSQGQVHEGQGESQGRREERHRQDQQVVVSPNQKPRPRPGFFLE